MKKVMQSLFFILILLFLSGCQTDDNDSSKSAKEKQVAQEEEGSNEDLKTANNSLQISQLELIPLPQTIDEILQYPRGELAGNEQEDKKIEEILQDIPEYPKDASEDDINKLFHYLYSLYKDDYIDSRNVIESFELAAAPGEKNLEQLEQVEHYNVEIILDASGSMAGKLGSKTKMELAKESIKQYASSMYEHANVALRVYGHKGSNEEKDKALSCSSSELIYPLQAFDQQKLNQALQSFLPTGWTPLAHSMQEAIKDFRDVDSANSRNIIYIVSDGIETCDGDPIKAAEELKNSGFSPIVNIIGFNVDQEGQEQLKKVAEAADGSYVTVQNQEQLNQEFKRTFEEYIEWTHWVLNADIDANGYYLEQKRKLQSDLLEWKRIAIGEAHNIQRTSSALWYSGKITSEQNNKIIDMKNDFYNNQNRTVEQLFKELNNNLQSIYDYNKEKIDEMFENRDQ